MLNKGNTDNEKILPQLKEENPRLSVNIVSFKNY